MAQKGKKYLIVTSILEIILGIVSIILIRFLLAQEGSVPILSQEVGQDALWGLIVLYGFAGFRIFAGILGICFSHKKSAFLLIIGILLVLVHASNFVVGDFSWLSILMNGLIVLVPAYYLYGAYLNYKKSE